MKKYEIYQALLRDLGRILKAIEEDLKPPRMGESQGDLRSKGSQVLPH